MRIKRANISPCIDLLFCFVVLPPIIMMLPIEKWIVNHTGFMLTLVAYLYGLYFIYRKAKLPALFMQHKYGKMLLLMAVLVIATILLTQFPFPPTQSGLSETLRESKRHIRTHTIWLLFLVVTGFSLSIELVFELFRQIILRKAIEAEKKKAELALSKVQEGAPGQHKQTSKSIVVKQEYNNISIPTSDIIYIEAMENYAKIYRVDGEHVLSHASMKSIQEMLPGDRFLRIHRSYIISRDKVEFFSKSKIKLVGEERTLPVGRQFANSIYDKLGTL